MDKDAMPGVGAVEQPSSRVGGGGGTLLIQTMPGYVEHLHADPAGTVNAGDLPNPLPFNLTPTNFFRTVEDIHEVLHEVNSLMHAKGYQRMEELLDPAGFSGMVSRTGVDRLSRASHALGINKT